MYNSRERTQWQWPSALAPRASVARRCTCGSFSPWWPRLNEADISTEVSFPPPLPIPGTSESKTSARDRSHTPRSPSLVFLRSSRCSNPSGAKARGIAETIVLSVAKARREPPGHAAGSRPRRRFWVASPRPVFLICGDASLQRPSALLCSWPVPSGSYLALQRLPRRHSCCCLLCFLR